MAEENQQSFNEQNFTQKIQIESPVLYSNKAFSPYRNFKLLNKNVDKNSSTITTENVIPHLKEEAEREELTKDLIESSYKSVKQQRSKKKRWTSFIFLMINLAVLVGIFIYQFSNEEPVSFADLLSSKMNWWWLIIGVLLFMIINILDSARISLAMKKATGRWRPFTSYKSTLTCRFYDSITPLATGGQPFQIYYLSKRGLNASTASSVPLAKYVYSQIAFILYTLVILLVTMFGGYIFEPWLVTMAWVGLALNSVLIASVFLLSVSKKTAPRIMIWLLKLGSKLRLVKDYRATFRRVMRTVKEYTSTFKMFMKSGWMAFFQFLISLVYLTACYTVPFVVYCMFHDTATIQIWFELLMLQVICDLAIGFIPLPGGAGTAELSFAVLFSAYFTQQGIFVWAMLFWRVFTYYGYLIQGALLLLYDFAIGNRKIEPLLQRFKDEDKARAENLNKVVLSSENAGASDLGKQDTKNKRRK